MTETLTPPNKDDIDEKFRDIITNLTVMDMLAQEVDLSTLPLYGEGQGEPTSYTTRRTSKEDGFNMPDFDPDSDDPE
jgi:hypothetical protein